VARNQHVVPRGREWAVVAEGSQRATRVAPTKREAREIARTIARNQGTDVLIHERDGRTYIEDIFGRATPCQNGLAR
jgi:hypothetical protein